MNEPTVKHPVRLDAYELRRLADAAASARGPLGDPYYLVQEGSFIVLQHDDPGVYHPDDNIVLEVDTRDQAARPRVTYAAIASGDESFNLEQYDAVFWSESAVEKFLFPYYASRGMWNAAYTLSAISEMWYGFVPQPGVDGGRAEPADLPFAVAHLPDSDYVAIPPGDQPGHELHLLFRSADGKTVYPRSLAELIQEREAGRPGTAGPATQTPASPDGA